jgi:hypothetical protein
MTAKLTGESEDETTSVATETQTRQILVHKRTSGFVRSIVFLSPVAAAIVEARPSILVFGPGWFICPIEHRDLRTFFFCYFFMATTNLITSLSHITIALQSLAI